MSYKKTHYTINWKLSGKSKTIRFLLKYMRGLFNAYDIAVDELDVKKTAPSVQSTDELDRNGFLSNPKFSAPICRTFEWSAPTRFDPDQYLSVGDLIRNAFLKQIERETPRNDKPAETKDQVIHDAKIQIENMMRRLRVLNVEENIFAPDLPPRTPAENLSTAVTRVIYGERAWPELYKHLSAALREAERLTPASKLTDDESGETD